MHGSRPNGQVVHMTLRPFDGFEARLKSAPLSLPGLERGPLRAFAERRRESSPSQIHALAAD